MAEEVYTWIGVFGFAIAVIALMFSFGAGGSDLTFNSKQFLNNTQNISINETWLSGFGNVTYVNNTYINQTLNITNNITNNITTTITNNFTNNITNNDTLDFGNTTLVARGYNVHSDFYTGDALELIRGIKAEDTNTNIGTGAIKVGGIDTPITSDFVKIDHSTIGGAMEIVNGQETQSLDKTLAILIKANQQLIEQIDEQNTQIKELQDAVIKLGASSEDFTKSQDLQNQAICSFKLFDWCMIK